MRFVVLLSAMILSGCVSGRVLPAGVSGNEMFVSVSNVWNESEALPYAEKHCRSHGKAPRFKEMRNYRAVFDCIRPDA